MGVKDGPPRAAVVGAGPAGLIAAQTLAGAGAQVTVYERAAAPARKFLLAGRGGLNLTHSEAMPTFLGRYGAAAATLEPHLGRFGPTDLREWCHDLGDTTFVGSSGRVFPKDFRANRLLQSWLERLDHDGVELRTGHRWTGWAGDALLIEDADGTVHPSHPDITILALGGASWPGTGSDGSWVPVIEHEGVRVAPLRPANSGFVVDWSEEMVQRHGGSPVKNVAVSIDGARARGELMVTDTGLEGGALYAVSAALREAVDRDGSAVLVIDLLPDLEPSAVRARLARRRAKDSAGTVLGRVLGLDPVKSALVREATANRVPSDPDELADLVGALPLRVQGPEGIERAISSAGGVAFDQVDDRLMLVARPGTFVAGEMLDWDAPTGGYLLQASFSTGVAAAEGALAWLRER